MRWRTGTWQGPVRIGHLGAVALRYAAEVAGGVDAIAVTHLDTAARSHLMQGRSYQVDGHRLERITPGPERDRRGTAAQVPGGATAWYR